MVAEAHAKTVGQGESGPRPVAIAVATARLSLTIGFAVTGKAASAAGCHRPQFGHGVSHDDGEVPVVVSAGPPLYGHTQDRHAGLGNEGRLRLAHTSLAQGGGDRCGVAGQLGPLPLPQFGVGGDHGVALAGQVPAELAEHGGGSVEALGHGVEGTVGRRRAGHPSHDPFLEEGRTTEEHFPLVGEVPEEGALGDPGSEGDLSGGGLVEPPLCVQSQSRFLQPPATVRLPSTHDLDPTVDSH